MPGMKSGATPPIEGNAACAAKRAERADARSVREPGRPTKATKLPAILVDEIERRRKLLAAGLVGEVSDRLERNGAGDALALLLQRLGMNVASHARRLAERIFLVDPEDEAQARLARLRDRGAAAPARASRQRRSRCRWRPERSRRCRSARRRRRSRRRRPSPPRARSRPRCCARACRARCTPAAAAHSRGSVSVVSMWLAAASRSA